MSLQTIFRNGIAMTAYRNGVAQQSFRNTDSLIGVRARFAALAETIINLAREIQFTDGPATDIYGYGAGGTYNSTGQYIESVKWVAEHYPSLISTGDLATFIDCYVSATDGNFFVPDYINYDNSEGTIVGGCTKHLLTGSTDFIWMVYLHWQRTGSLAKFIEHEAFIGDLITAQLALIDESGLVVVDQTQSDWEWMDSAPSVGMSLSGSVFLWNALQQLDLMRAANSESAIYGATRDAISAGLIAELWDAEAGLFRHASTTNVQHNVPVSAMVVNFGICPSVAGDIQDGLIAAVNGGAAWNGLIRYMPAGEYWDDPGGTPQGAYLNGGYWGTFTSWVSKAIRSRNQSLADSLMQDLCDFYDDDGANVFEYYGEDHVGAGTGSSNQNFCSAIVTADFYWS